MLLPTIPAPMITTCWLASSLDSELAAISCDISDAGQARQRTMRASVGGRRWVAVSMAAMPSQKQRMLTGEAYFADDPELLADRCRAGLLTARLNATSVAQPPLRRQILADLLGALGAQ